MEIRLTNGTELTPLSIYGCSAFVQGAKRDTLYFVFPVSEGFDKLDSMFTQENCETITIIENGEKTYLHKEYTIRAELSKKSVLVGISEDGETLHEERLTVAMAQRTPYENQLKEMESAMKALAGVGV